ncbi:MAG: pyrophosphatase [SAR86 cluster bacterium]|jgi:NTP pyrophosphatase (non-canonical NTP hydrolase)|nr:pyrophosphatase [SAR86 cluster bacterium]MBL6810906.1 pyrophosphatase [SAR86 cluster bacterium]
MSDEVKKFFSTYGDFVKKVTSKPSLDLDALKQSLEDVETKSPIESARLMTAALGLGSETGEFVEIVKKMFLQGKPPSEENIFHMKRELGDIMWYWVTACSALDLDPFEVIKENQDKLEARYGEKFEVQRSEVRKKGDL